MAPAEIERVVEDIEGVRRGCVAAFGGVRHDEGVDEGVVAVETRLESSTEQDALVREIRKMVAKEAAVQIDEVVLLAPTNLPKTTSGKIQRR